MSQTVEGMNDPVLQFSLFMENKLGKLHDLIRVLTSRDVHVLALTTLDTTDSSILRLIVDDHESARTIFKSHGIVYNETTVLALEMRSTTDLHRMLSALLEAEINIHYTYAFMVQPHGTCLMALNMEDPDVGAQVFNRCGFRVLNRGDLTR